MPNDAAQKLDTAGYTVNSTSDKGVISDYFKIRHHRISRRPRTIHKASYTAPSHLVNGEQLLLNKIRKGLDLWPHQSRNILDITTECDKMLYTWDIQHFHLGTELGQNHERLISGTSELLFAIVRDDDLYAIRIYDHRSWTKKAVLDTVHATWPKLMASCKSHGVTGLAHDITDDELKALRGANINTPYQAPDGAVYTGMGLGITTSGTSITARGQTNKLISCVEGLQNVVVKVYEQEVAKDCLSSDAGVQLIWIKDQVFAVSDSPSLRSNLTGHLTIPPI